MCVLCSESGRWTDIARLRPWDGLLSKRMQRARRVSEWNGQRVGKKKKKHVRDCDKWRNREINWAWGWLERNGAGMWRESREQIALSLITNYISQRIWFHASPCTRRDMSTQVEGCVHAKTHTLGGKRQLFQFPRRHAEKYDRESLFISFYTERYADPNLNGL